MGFPLVTAKAILLYSPSMAQTTTQIDSKYAQANRRWVALDAKSATLGRLASHAANLLRGKNKPYFTPVVDCGDFVVVTNAAKLRLTGNKLEVKNYFSHSGYAAGKRIMPVKLQMERDARKVVYKAVKRMLPVNRLRQHQLRRLKIYVGDSHPHASQMAEVSRG